MITADTARRLALCGIAKVRILKTREIATIVKPGAIGKKITLIIDKNGKQSNQLPKDIELLQTLAPKPPRMALDQQCGMCHDKVATSKCSACGTPACSQECTTKNWKSHKPVCHDGQANRFAEEWARENNRAVQLSVAAMRDDVKAIQKLVDDLSVAVRAALQGPRSQGHSALGPCTRLGPRSDPRSVQGLPITMYEVLGVE